MEEFLESGSKNGHIPFASEPLTQHTLKEVADLYLSAKQVQKDCQGAKKAADTKVKQSEPDLKAAKKIQQAGIF